MAPVLMAQLLWCSALRLHGGSVHRVISYTIEPVKIGQYVYLKLCAEGAAKSLFISEGLLNKGIVKQAEH